jgi:hypothetical protein
MTTSRSCTACGRDDASFPVKGSRCLDCRRAAGREHYRRNREYYLAKARARQLLVIEEARAWLVTYLLEHSCVDCGISDIRVLEFDHRDGVAKRTAVSVLVRSGYSLAAIRAEIAKCEVRCANCHRIRTHEQRRWWGSSRAATTTERSAPGGIRTPKPSDP